MGKETPPVVKRSLGSWIFDGNIGLQIALILVILVTVSTRLVPLEMQKRIVNEAIGLRKLDLLGIYCAIYLSAILLNAGLKFTINILQTRISEKATAGMRRHLYHHILTLPLEFFRTTQPGTVVNSLVNELTLPGNFIGMAVAAPATNILTLVAFAVYLFFLNPILALISMSIYPVMLYVIPLLQKRVNQYNQERVTVSRDLSSKIVESITGIHEVQANGAVAVESSKFNTLVAGLMKIRVWWTIYKFAVKLANNLFTSLGPVLIFILGGYLAIRGRLELGALVAFLSAQEKLYDPWRELIEFYQVYQDGSVVYKKTMAYFDAPVKHRLVPENREPMDLEGTVSVENLSLETSEGLKLLDDINLDLKSGEHIALVGFSGSGKSSLALCIAQLYTYTSGHASIGGHEISQLTKADITRSVGLVSQSPFIFSGTIRENLLYAFVALHGTEGVLSPELEPSLDDLISVLQQSGLFVDVLRFGLSTVIDNHDNTLVPAIISMRRKFQESFGKEVVDWVEFFHDGSYISYASIADNIIFGTPANQSFSGTQLVRNPVFKSFLDEECLTAPLVRLGRELVEQTVDILKNLPLEKVFFEQSPISIESFGFYKSLVPKLKDKTPDNLEDYVQSALLEVALNFSPARHKTAVLPGPVKSLILESRHRFREKILETEPGAIAFYRDDTYICTQSILNNMLFGLTKTSATHVQEKINQMIVHLLIEDDLLEAIIEIGMNFDVGTMGNRLSGGQCQKLAIARIFLKAPSILIFDEATSALDNLSQQRIQNVLERNWKGRSTMVAVVHRLDIIKNYDKVGFMKAGKIVEYGSYDQLMNKKGFLHDLIREGK
ncbi:MAG: ABC transporter ATP-binding protein/permease [Pseudomonadota bacterium]